MKVVAFVPAKGSSSRLANKNNLPIFNEPLYIHALKKLLQSHLIDEVYLDTESEEFIRYTQSKGLKCNFLKRNPKLADNRTDGNQLLLNEAKYVSADIYVQLLCTSPFIKVETINKGIKTLMECSEYDSVVAVRREKLYLWNEQGPLYDINCIPNSNTLEDTVIETMGLYMITSAALSQTKRRIGNKPYLLSVSQIEAIDINYPEDYQFAKIVERGLLENV